MTDAVIVAAARTPVGKAPAGTLRTTRPDELAAIVLREVLARAPGISPGDVDDVILGCAMPEAEQGMNVARLASLRAGVPVTASAVTVNRFCASGLQAIAYAAERVMTGSADVILAGGTESMSMVPLGGHKVAPNPTLIETHPDVYLTTGLVAENHARPLGTHATTPAAPPDSDITPVSWLSSVVASVGLDHARPSGDVQIARLVPSPTVAFQPTATRPRPPGTAAVGTPPPPNTPAA